MNPRLTRRQGGHKTTVTSGIHADMIYEVGDLILMEQDDK